MTKSRRNRRKPRRNDPCWCQSGKKYKRCHSGRENQHPLQPWDVAKTFKREFSAKRCLAPEAWLRDCRGGIVQAHTVPKSGSLQRIARNGHVHSYILRPENVWKHGGIPVPELLGINQASTFPGFCSRHDNSIFQPLENEAFVGTPEQCFLIGYRAQARELHVKNAADGFSPTRRDLDKGKELGEQIAIQTLTLACEVGIKVDLRDLHHYKQKYDDILQTRRFDTVRGYVIEFEAPPPVMCSGILCPGQDFNGNELQDIADLSSILDQLCFSSFHGGKCGIVVFSWLAESDRTCRSFVESLKAIPDELVTAALLRLFFTHCENIHMNPDWWEVLSEQIRNALVTRMISTADIEKGLPHAVLADDGICHTPWAILRRYEVPASP